MNTQHILFLCSLLAITSHLVAMRELNNITTYSPKIQQELDKDLLHYAEVNDVAMVRELLNKDANSNVCDDCKIPLVCLVARGGHFEVLQVLLEHNKYLVNEKNIAGDTPLHCACNPMYTCEKRGQTQKKIIRLLLQYDAPVNAQNFWGHTPLHYVTLHGDLRMVELFVQYGADCTISNKKNRGPLSDAIEQGYMDIIQFFVNNNNFDINAKISFERDTALHIACVVRRVNVIQFLLEKGADVNVENKRGLSPLDNMALMKRYLIKYPNNKVDFSQDDTIKRMLVARGAKEPQNWEHDGYGCILQ